MDYEELRQWNPVPAELNPVIKYINTFLVETWMDIFRADRDKHSEAVAITKLRITMQEWVDEHAPGKTLSHYQILTADQAKEFGVKPGMYVVLIPKC